jgi:hypothetical protein
MTTTTIAWRWSVLENRPALRISSSQDLEIPPSASLLSNDNILFLCDECHAPITFFPIPILMAAILCPDCFRKHTGLLLNLAVAETGFLLRKIKE